MTVRILFKGKMDVYAKCQEDEESAKLKSKNYQRVCVRERVGERECFPSVGVLL